MTLGEILRELIEDSNTTQKEIAETFGFEPSTFGNYVQGTRAPDLATLKKLADCFYVTTDFLLDRRTDNAVSYNEDVLLRVYRSLTPDQQEITIKFVKLFSAQNHRKENPDNLMIASKKPRYRANDKAKEKKEAKDKDKEKAKDKDKE